VIVPNLVSGAGVDGPDVIGHGEEKDAVDQQGRGLDGRVLVGLEGPGETENFHVLRRDLFQRAVAAAGVVAVVEGPGVGRGMQDLIGFKVLRLQAGSDAQQGGREDP
jgi:hypothetical protein